MPARSRVTPALSAVYDELSARASAPREQRTCARLCARSLLAAHLFFDSAVARTEPEDRMRAAWDDAITTRARRPSWPTASRIEANALWRGCCRGRTARSFDEPARHASYRHRCARWWVVLGLAARRHRPRGARARRRGHSALRGAHRRSDRRMRHAPGRSFFILPTRPHSSTRSARQPRSAACLPAICATRSCACSTRFAICLE